MNWSYYHYYYNNIIINFSPSAQMSLHLTHQSPTAFLLIIRVVAALSNRRRQSWAEPGASGGKNTQAEQRVRFFKLLKLDTGFSLHSHPSWGSRKVPKSTVRSISGLLNGRETYFMNFTYSEETEKTESNRVSGVIMYSAHLRQINLWSNSCK